jgi:glycosyltransferase involved in cell wall biosynthesis
MGVNLIGPDGDSSLAVKTRDYAEALRSSGIAVTVHHPSFKGADARSRNPLDSRRVPNHAFTIIVVQPLFIKWFELPVAITTGRFVIANWIWEQTELPQQYVHATAIVDEIWASSEFVRSTYERAIDNGKLDKRVTLIPHPVRRVESPDAPMNRSRFGIPDDHYVFLTIAASTSSFVRKHPLGSLHAFRAAFPHGQTDAILAIKLLAGGYNPSAEEQRELFSTDPAFGDDVILIIEAFTDSEMTELVRCCDAFVSLHRAEGFGLGAAEAMSLGKPVIVTNWSGPVDFLTPENSLPVPYELVTIDDPGMDFYLPGLEWAEPDLSVAASHMRLVVDDPALGEALGRRAKIDIERRHSIDAAGATMAARLRQLHGS